MLDSFSSGNGVDGGDTETNGEPAPGFANSAANGQAPGEEAATTRMHAAPRGRAAPRTSALDAIRQESADLADLLALSADDIPIFIYRLIHAVPGLKALEQRGANITALRAACADRIQKSMIDGGASRRPAGTTMDDLITRAVEIAQSHPDPGARMANVGDAVAALYLMANSDGDLRELLAGRRLLSFTEQMTAETERIAAIVQSALDNRMGQAEKAIIGEVVRSRPTGVSPMRLAAGIAFLCAAAGLAIYWAGGLPQLRQAIAALSLLAS